MSRSANSGYVLTKKGILSDLIAKVESIHGQLVPLRNFILPQAATDMSRTPSIAL
jgi:hypothetical protein